MSARDTAASSTNGPPSHAYPQIILFGDSITQYSESNFAAALREQYLRKADVINRGFSGYTAKLALDVLPKFYPSPSQARVRVMLVFFGANDACLPGSPQHVSVGKYSIALRDILQHDMVRRQGTKIILITPGPVDEWQLGDEQRTAENTKFYATACRAVGKAVKIPVVDLWSTFMREAGWKGEGPLMGSKDCERSDVLARLLSDGLHFTAEAYEIMFQEVMRVLQKSLPEETPGRMPYVFPLWTDLFPPNT